ncbi:hypothetical protein Ac2012v2_005316 [Leucoagaricus gongylophorus]
MHLKSMYPDPPPNPSMLNAYSVLAGRSGVADWPDFTAHVEYHTGKKYSFKEVCARINYLATALGAPTSLEGLGLEAGSGERIGIMSDNSSDYAILVVSLLKIAVPFIPISCYATPFELRHILSLTQVTRLFVAPQFMSRVLPITTELGISNHEIYFINEDISGQVSVESLIRRVKEKRIPEEPVRIVPKDTPGYLVFSGGTTGLPKAVMVSHGNITCTVMQGILSLAEVLKLGDTPIPVTDDGIPATLAYLPMHHTAGIHACSFRFFFGPSRLIIFPRWDIQAIMDAIPKYKATVLYLVPTMVQQLLVHPMINNIDFSSVLTFICIGGHLPRESRIKLVSLPQQAQQAVQFAEGYGLSECSGGALLQPQPGELDGRGKENIDASGILLPGMEARIVRDDGSEADRDEAGELWLRGENVVMGYWNNPEANTTNFVDGWLRTGDIFKVDKDQYFYFADRIKDTLKVSGIQVSPMEIEEVLMTHPEKLITDVCVAGVSGGQNGDEKVPRAWIILSSTGNALGASDVIEELRAWHQTHLSKHKWLQGGIEVVSELPKSQSGKTLKRVLQERYENCRHAI